jgi:hypothetical protein
MNTACLCGGTLEVRETPMFIIAECDSCLYFHDIEPTELYLSLQREQQEIINAQQSTDCEGLPTEGA